MTLYEPEPSCGLSSADVIYNIVNEEQMPAWVLYNDNDKQVEIEAPDNLELPVDTVIITIEASLPEIDVSE